MRRDVQRMPKSQEKSTRKTQNMTKIREQCCAVWMTKKVSGKKNTWKEHVRTWYTLVRTVHYQIGNRQDPACPDTGVGPSVHFTQKIWNWRKICRKNIFSKNSFRTRMYNQLIKQSNSISKIYKDIIES
jgi:hypothetical protein